MEPGRRRWLQMPPSFDHSLLEIHGNIEEVRQQMLDISTLAKERSAIQKAASRLRFLTPWVEAMQPGPQSRYRVASKLRKTQKDLNYPCQNRGHFGTVINTVSRSSQSTSDEAFHCACECMEDFKMVLTTSGAIPSCPRYVAVSYC
jgi:hypothetical protein